MKTFKLFKLFSMHHRTAVCSLNVSSFISANVYLNFMATEQLASRFSLGQYFLILPFSYP